MGCLGVHFSFPAGAGGQLWDGDEASRAFVEELEDRWDTYYLQQTDKAWDPIHRCLADGTLAWAGDDPDREGLIWTPDRVVRASEEFYDGYAGDLLDLPE